MTTMMFLLLHYICVATFVLDFPYNCEARANSDNDYNYNIVKTDQQPILQSRRSTDVLHTNNNMIKSETERLNYQTPRRVKAKDIHKMPIKHRTNYNYNHNEKNSPTKLFFDNILKNKKSITHTLHLNRNTKDDYTNTIHTSTSSSRRNNRRRVRVRVDPDANRNLTQLIVSQGFPVETYVVKTKDGFLLDLHRIPHGRNNNNNNNKNTHKKNKKNKINNVNINTNNNKSYNNNDNDDAINKIININNSNNYYGENTIFGGLFKSNDLSDAKNSSFLQRLIDDHTSNNAMPSSNNSRPPVFLQHGYLSTACDFVMNFANDSLAFVLADAGYDVWLGNSRGNTYSRRHVKLNVNDTKFWDWSFDEMAQYDTSAFIDFVLNKTSQSSLYYIGHSQGTMVAFALLSELPQYQEKIRLFVGLAPIMSLAHMRSPMKYLAGVNESIIYDLLGRNECFLSTNKTRHMAVTTCASPATRLMCDAMLFLSNGPDISNLNQTRLPVYMSHTPAGTSVKNVVHYAQMVREKRFAKYDYGTPSENVKKYGQPIPPAYNVSSIRVPALLFSASKDWLADPTDVSILESTLPNIRDKYTYPSWNHMDFVLGMDAARLCYSQILKSLPNFD